MSDATQSRGYRNKNPGNIDFNPANQWQGQVGLGDRWISPATSRRFAEFESHEYGIRALAALLTTYQDRHGLRTVRGIINRWAPPVENDTSSYVIQVAKAIGKGPDELLDLHKYEDLLPLVWAVIRHELGGQPYSAETINDGLRLAGVPRPVETVAEAAATSTGRGAMTVGAAAAAAAAIEPALSAVARMPQWTGVALVAAVAVAAIVYVLMQRRSKAA